MAIDGVKFLQATNPNINPMRVNQGQNYYNKQPMQPISQPVNYQPKVGLPTIEDMELATKAIDNNFFVTPVNQVNKGYQPFGTGELSPVLDGREDEIADCPWNEYYA